MNVDSYTSIKSKSAHLSTINITLFNFVFIDRVKQINRRPEKHVYINAFFFLSVYTSTRSQISNIFLNERLNVFRNKHMRLNTIKKKNCISHGLRTERENTRACAARQIITMVMSSCPRVERLVENTGRESSLHVIRKVHGRTSECERETTTTTYCPV